MDAPRSPRAPHPSAPTEPDTLGELTHDAITASFRILQRAHGHRYAIDDVLTAWEAVHAMPSAARCLDLGSGIGSVLLMVAYKLPDAHFVAVEAQRNSHQLLCQNIAGNGLTARAKAVHADLRDSVGQAPVEGPFDLITGTPPYATPGTATPSSDAQRAYARQEFRGGVEAYLTAAAPVLSPHGRLVVCADARFPERVLKFADRVGLVTHRQLDMVPRAGAAGPLFSVFTLAHAGVPAATTADVARARATWVARDADGTRSRDYRDVRAFFGLPSRS